jgi:DNA invertase Pin-like site-specific DNA recombinase
MILAAFAEFERKRIAQHIRDVKRSQKADGQYLGGSIPFGFRLGDDDKLKPDSEEQSVIKKIVRMKNKGMSMRAISSHLLQSGTRISHVTVGRILRDSQKPF